MFNSRAVTLLLTTLYRVAADFTAWYVVFPYFGGFGRLEFSLGKTVESYALTLILAGISSWRSPTKPSHVILYFQLLMVVLPLLTFYSLSDAPAGFIYTIAGAYALLVVIVRYGHSFRFSAPVSQSRLIPLFFTALTAVTYGYLVASGGLLRINFDFSKVYEVREDYFQELPALIQYTLFWQAFSVNTAILILALIRRWKTVVLLVFLLQAFLFGMTNFKSFLFAPVLIAGVFFFLRRWTNSRQWLHFIILSLLMIGALSCWIFYTFDFDLVVSLLVRRILYIPANLHLLYYDFFSQHPKVLLADTLRGLLTTNPYDAGIGPMIMAKYFGRDGNANAGVFAHAYAQLGVIGIFVFAGLLGLLCHVVDGLAAHLPPAVSCGLIAMPAFALTNSGLTVCLFTHGMVISMIAMRGFPGPSAGTPPIERLIE